MRQVDVYNDFNGLAQLKTGARQQSSEAIKEVARHFESLFINMALKSMRSAKLSDGILDNRQSEFYRDMYDQQMSLHLSGEPGIGLADMIVRQLSPADQPVKAQYGLEDYRARPAFRPIQHKPGQAPNAPQQKPEAVAVQAQEKMTFESPEAFIRGLMPQAQAAAKQLGVEPEVLLAQAALETGWGKAVIKQVDRSSYNLFNIKATSKWSGQKMQKSTLEFVDGVGRQEKAYFRAYDSFAESFADYVNLIQNNQRYAEAVKAVKKPAAYMQALQQGGYATDPQYADKVMRIYQQHVVPTVNAKLAMR